MVTPKKRDVRAVRIALHRYQEKTDQSVREAVRAEMCDVPEIHAAAGLLDWRIVDSESSVCELLLKLYLFLEERDGLWVIAVEADDPDSVHLDS